jgi:hypothetical protein
MKNAEATIDMPRIGVQKGGLGKITREVTPSMFMVDFGGPEKTVCLCLGEQFRKREFRKRGRR